MEEIKTIEEALDYIRRYLNISVTDVSKDKWHLLDEDIDFNLSSDRELIEYANEQKEAEE